MTTPARNATEHDGSSGLTELAIGAGAFHRTHPDLHDLPLRSNPASRGDGLRLAREAGAAAGPDGAGFYGHLVPSGIPFADSGDFVGLSLYLSEHALLFNLANERFVDESVGGHLTTMALGL